jgi:hypothetical protein
VTRRSEDEVRESYADLLEDETDAATIRLIADLDAGLTGSEPPPELWSGIPSRAVSARRGASTSGRTPSPGPSPATQERGSVAGMAGRRLRAPLAEVMRLRRGRPPRLPSSESSHPSNRAATGGRPYAMDGDPADSGTGRAAARLLHRKPLRLRWIHLPAIAGLLSLLAVGVGFAVSNIANLGSPTNDVATLPLGAFHPIRTALRQHGKPELLFIGTSVDAYTAAERWPVVKALDQFGTFAGLKMGAVAPCSADRESRVTCMPPANRSFVTFDWQHARYTSPYLVFVHRELIDSNGRVLQLPSSRELSLVKRYVAVPGYPNWHDTVWQTAENAAQPDPHHFPLLLVDSYLETGAEVAIPGDLSEKAGSHALPFATIQDSLRTGKPIGQAPASLISDFNEEANAITALICHADGKKPVSVCNRPSIKAILKRVK